MSGKAETDKSSKKEKNTLRTLTQVITEIKPIHTSAVPGPSTTAFSESKDYVPCCVMS